MVYLDLSKNDRDFIDCIGPVVQLGYAKGIPLGERTATAGLMLNMTSGT